MLRENKKSLSSIQVKGEQFQPCGLSPQSPLSRLLSALTSLPKEKISLENRSYFELKSLIAQTDYIVNLRNEAVRQLLSSDINLYPESTSPEEDSEKTFNEEDYDIILDLNQNHFLYRKDPVGHSPLKNAELKGVGHRRIDVLAYLLEHPKMSISIENVSSLPSQTDIVEPNALAKTISVLRKTLEQKGSKGPYIITERSLGSPFHIYKVNQKWKYRVVREKSKKKI